MLHLDNIWLGNTTVKSFCFLETLITPARKYECHTLKQLEQTFVFLNLWSIKRIVIINPSLT